MQVSRYLATDLLLPELAYHFSETFVKKLVGRTDIEDALRSLETVTVEEARMTGAEALKAIHSVGKGIHDAVKVVEDRMRDVKGMIQGVDDRVKGIVDMVVIGAQKMLNLSSLSSMFILWKVPRMVQGMLTTYTAP